MLFLSETFMNAEISIVFDNAKTHEPKREMIREPRRGVRRCFSADGGVRVSGKRNSRRRTSTPSIPVSRWKAEPLSPASKEALKVKLEAAPTCVLRNVLKPVRQQSLENIHQKSNDASLARSLMPIMPVRQQSLRDMMGCSPDVSTVSLLSQALEHLDAFEEEDFDLDTQSVPALSCGLPTVLL
jgi:hypothetical protein